MRILFLTFYYEPDLCAGSFRNTPLSKVLSNKLTSNDEIHVITTMPNRYKAFDISAPNYENIGNITIERVKIPQHQSGFIDQINSFRTYFFSVLRKVESKEYDLVYASSSRLFTAFLGRYIAKKKNIPLYLDIRDIFTDTLNDVIKSRLTKFFLIPYLKLIERYTFSKANNINLVSEGFKEYFSRYPIPTYTYYTNGIDDVFTAINKKGTSSKAKKNIITYAGNIGEGQGLHKIVPQIASRLKEYHWRIIGDGGKLKNLKNEIEALELQNVEILSPVSRPVLINYYLETDFLFLHLNDYEAFKKVLPSKLFEYGAFNVPIIAGVAGYSADFIKANLTNFILFNPGDYDSLVSQLKNFEYKTENRLQFIHRFKRENILDVMTDDIINLKGR